MRYQLHLTHSSCRSQLAKLPDKGQKLQILYDRILEALSAQNEIETASQYLEKLNISSKHVNEMEWKVKKAPNGSQPELDSDDEDPLAVLASSNTTTGNQKITRIVKDENSLITEEDLKEAKEGSSLHFEPVVEQMCRNENMEPSHRFIPSKPNPAKVKSSNSSLSSQEGAPKQRDNSSATPPTCVHLTKQLTLRESMELEHAHLKRMQAMREQQAAERLAAKPKDTSGKSMSVSFDKAKDLESSIMTKYREVVSLIDAGESDEESVNSGGEEDYGE